tara:strand:+ start:181 stop:1197 length:1017 start_codon:yes stop_codon:yes gene_type:complete
MPIKIYISAASSTSLNNGNGTITGTGSATVVASQNNDFSRINSTNFGEYVSSNGPDVFPTHTATGSFAITGPNGFNAAIQYVSIDHDDGTNKDDFDIALNEWFTFSNGATYTFSGQSTLSFWQAFPYSTLIPGTYSLNDDFDTLFGSNQGQLIVLAPGQVVPSGNAPTNLAASAYSFNENISAGTTVATLISTNQDSGDSHTYSLVSGTGSTDNSAFTISGNSLKIAASPDYETKSSYAIRLQTDDGNGGTYQKALTFNVNNQNDAPTGSVTISGTVTQGQTLTTANTLADADGLGNISYQWKRASAVISGATSSTYSLFQADVGSAITVTASYTDEQ